MIGIATLHFLLLPMDKYKTVEFYRRDHRIININKNRKKFGEKGGGWSWVYLLWRRCW